MKGAALDKFILERKGKRWDGVPVPSPTVSDLKNETFDFLRKRAIKAQRIEDDVLTDSNELLADNCTIIAHIAHRQHATQNCNSVLMLMQGTHKK